MKLILCLSLAWMISSTAETLRCIRAPGSGTPGPYPCDSADDWCATETSSVQGENPSKHVERFCVAPFLCAAHNQIVSFSNAKLSAAKHLHCCRTDGCNHQNFPYPDPGKPNGLRCLTCTGVGPDHVCNSTVECVGTQDRCLGVYAKYMNTHRYEDTDIPYFGCVSSNVCDLVSQLKFRQDFAARYNFHITPRVPGSSICSSAGIVNPDVAALLLGLFTMFVFHNQS